MKIELRRSSQLKDANICLFSKQVFNSLNLAEGVQYNIHFGQGTESVQIGLNDAEDNVMVITDSLFHDFLIFDGMKLNIRREEKDIYLGPVVGQFVNSVKLKEYKEGTAPRQHGRGALLENCLLYVFSIYDIDWENRRIKGYTLLPDSEKWEEGWFPMPDIIYDRGAGFKKVEKHEVKTLRAVFREVLKIKFINSKDYLGKKTICKELSKFPEASDLLPMTINYESFDDLFTMLKHYNFVFLKDSLGSGGKQVLSIEREGEKFKLTFYSGGLKQIILDSIEELRDYVKKYTKGSKFIVQEGIRLLKYRGGVFDMRILVIKDKEGKWRAVNNWGRIAKEGYTITNLLVGGEVLLYSDMYPELCSSHTLIKIPNEQEIGRVAIMLAEYIEKALGRFGEIGMDIGIDTFGRLWLIEANAKPHKDLDEEYDNFDKLPLRHLIIFEYAKYLTNFKN